MTMAAASPRISKRAGPSVVWLIPLITAIVGGWLIVKTVSEKGPVATISFKTAEGIEVGKTKVKYKNVEVGVVEGVQFSEDFKDVVLTVQFNKGTESFFRRNTRFWVVKPQLSFRGATGLSTLISGAYIEIEPGRGSPQYHFTGLEEQPVVTSDEVGKKVVLIAEKLRSIDVGSPVYYRGIQAGEVLGHELGNDRRSVYIHAFIKDPYAQLVRGNTRFWNVSGMDISMTADGLNVRTESMAALIYGGIAFDTPDTLERGADDVESLIYTLYDDYDTIQKYAYTRKINFVMYFEGSVRGLSIGAPVEFKGIRVGSVLDISLEFDREATSFRIPVLVEIEPERIMLTDDDGATPYATIQTLVDKGLRARLQTGSLITGQLYVELGMFPDTPARLVAAADSAASELPTIPAGLGAITDSIEAFVAKLNRVQVDKIGEQLLGSLEGANKLLNAPEIHTAVAELDNAMEALKSILTKADKADIRATITAARNALQKVDQTLTLTNRILQPNSPLQYNLIEMISELEETARSIRTLVESLERQPQALILGKDPEGE
jgi:paraquat-inducible protein B